MYYYGVGHKNIYYINKMWKRCLLCYFYIIIHIINFIFIYVNYKVDRGYYIDLYAYLLSLD